MKRAVLSCEDSVVNPMKIYRRCLSENAKHCEKSDARSHYVPQARSGGRPAMRVVMQMLEVLLVLCSVTAARAGHFGIYQHGTVVRMHMGDCLPAGHGFMVAFGGPAAPAGSEMCPEYTLVSEKVVYIIVGKSSDQLVPLADVIDFRLRNSELLVRVDDAPHESKFRIKEMILRSDWDSIQKHIADQLNSRRPVVSSALPENGGLAARNPD